MSGNISHTLLPRRCRTLTRREMVKTMSAFGAAMIDLRGRFGFFDDMLEES